MAIEVIYENNVFKPLGPVEGIEEHERMVAIFSRRPAKKSLRKLVGTMTHDEARAMEKCIDGEFEKVEGNGETRSGYQRGNRLP